MKKTLVSIAAGGESRHEPATRSETKTPRKCQAEAFALLKDCPHVLIEGPTGSGKSVSGKMLMVHKKKINPSAKSLVIVPQRAIVDAWGPCHIKGIGYWNPLLLTSERVSNVKGEVLKWAKQHNGDIVCTHMGLIRAWPEIRDQLALVQTTLWIDEAHHLEYLDTEDQECFVNQTANVLQEALAKGLEVGISSATLFRGDKSLVLNPSLRRLFKSYRMEFGEYIAGLEYIKDIRYVVETYKKSPLERLQPIRKKSGRGSIIYIPSPHSRESKKWSSGKKHKQVEEILKLLGNPQDQQGTIKTADGHRVTNLVCDEHLREKEQAIADGETDIIISLRRFLEGANWLEANTAYIIGRRQSPVQIIQILGRLLRDHPGKSLVRIVQLFPTPKTTSQAEIAKRVEDYLHTLCGTLLVRELLQPKHAILQKYGSETTFKALSAATTAFQKRVANESPKEAAERIHGAIALAAKRCQPEIDRKELRELTDTVETIVLHELETEEEALAESNEVLRPLAGLRSDSLRLRLTDRVNRIGRARENLRITSVNLAGEFPQAFQTVVQNHTEDLLSEIRELALENDITSLEEWHAWAEKYLAPDKSKRDDKCAYHPEQTPGWDSWETLMDPDLSWHTWDANFEEIITTQQLLTNHPLYLSGNRKEDAKLRWISRQRHAIRKNKPQVASLIRWMATKKIPAIPPIIPKDRGGEAEVWVEELGAPSLETNPKELRGFLLTKGVRANFLTKADPMVEDTIPVETYWFEAQNLTAKPGSLLDIAQRSSRKDQSRSTKGYIRFIKAVTEEKLRKKMAA